jgi:CheY-like chemotaxis protein
VLDLRLPDISGFDVLEAIRDDAELRDVPGRRLHGQGALERRGRAA